MILWFALTNSLPHCQHQVAIKHGSQETLGFPSGSDSKASTCYAGDPGPIPGSGRSPGEGKATHSTILAWRVPWTEEPGKLQSMGSQRVRHDWATEQNHPIVVLGHCVFAIICLWVFFIFFLVALVIFSLVRSVLLSLHLFVFFTVFPCNWYLISALWSEKMLNMISIFLNLWRFVLWPKIWSILESHVQLRRKCILLIWDGMPCKYQLSPSVLMCHLRLAFPYKFSFCIICSLV